MAIEIGESFVAPDIYTGKVDVTVLCINPDLATMIKLNLPCKKEEEPNYKMKNKEEEDVFILKVWIKHDNPEIITPITFFLQDKETNSSTTGKLRLINDFGMSTYATDITEAIGRLGKGGNPFFKEDGARVAKIGECELIDFLRNLFCVKQGGLIKLDNFTKLAKGDLTELNSYIKQLPADRKVQVLLTVKGEYQNVYNRYFERGGSKSNTYWEKHFSGSTADVEYQKSFNLKKFTGITPDVEAEATDTAANTWA